MNSYDFELLFTRGKLFFSRSFWSPLKETTWSKGLKHPERVPEGFRRAEIDTLLPLFCDVTCPWDLRIKMVT